MNTEQHLNRNHTNTDTTTVDPDPAYIDQVFLLAEKAISKTSLRIPFHDIGIPQLAEFECLLTRFRYLSDVELQKVKKEGKVSLDSVNCVLQLIAICFSMPIDCGFELSDGMGTKFKRVFIDSLFSRSINDSIGFEDYGLLTENDASQRFDEAYIRSVRRLSEFDDPAKTD
ncbi:unnamed protein product [Ambrosiozyma monospora]|uniref:Unnamed protein product n=1 Tax=Ambrosiozyma monospora TaxID=43982 RepID=A0ACB5UB80_AMBMO|nr:unnamed protein product [Ambrosiozyma monospora]